MSVPSSYPRWAIVEGDAIEQGDVFEDCPVFQPPADLTVAESAHRQAAFEWKQQDVIVLSQSCDLVKGQEKLQDVLICAVWSRSELTSGKLAKDDGMEEARKGRLPGFHVLADCTLDGYFREVRVVDFRRVYSLPVEFMRRRAAASARLRLLPPYREHLSQSFARYFMRVGLPVDIPPFTGKRR